MNQLGLIHPQMVGRLQPGLYPSLCTIQESDPDLDAHGQPIPDWTNLADHVNIAARLAPVMTNRAERRSQEQIYVVGQFHIALNGHYPAITEDMRALVDGVAYDIEHVEHDGNGHTTRLLVRKVD